MLNESRDPVRNMTLQKLQTLSERLQVTCRNIRKKLEDKRLGEGIRKALTEQLIDLEKTQAEIRHLEHRLMRL